MSNSLWSYGLWPARILCPCDSPGKNTGVGSHSLLQRIFPPRDQTHDSYITDRLFTCLSHQFLTVVFPNRFKIRQRKNTRSRPITTQERSWDGQIEITLAVVGPAPLTQGIKIAKSSEGHSGPRLWWGPWFYSSPTDIKEQRPADFCRMESNRDSTRHTGWAWAAHGCVLPADWTGFSRAWFKEALIRPSPHNLPSYFLFRLFFSVWTEQPCAFLFLKPLCKSQGPEITSGFLLLGLLFSHPVFLKYKQVQHFSTYLS